MHSNTSSEVFRVASRLMAKGANFRSISKEIFNTTKISTMRLWGRVMRKINKTPEGIAMSVVKQKDFDDTGADYSEMTGVVDYINSVPGAQYSVILTEKGGKVKGSIPLHPYIYLTDSYITALVDVMRIAVILEQALLKVSCLQMIVIYGMKVSLNGVVNGLQILIMIQ